MASPMVRHCATTIPSLRLTLAGQALFWGVLSETHTIVTPVTLCVSPVEIWLEHRRK
jgi:hypothetical protein